MELVAVEFDYNNPISYNDDVKYFFKRKVLEDSVTVEVMEKMASQTLYILKSPVTEESIDRKKIIGIVRSIKFEKRSMTIYYTLYNKNTKISNLRPIGSCKLKKKFKLFKKIYYNVEHLNLTCFSADVI